MNMKRNLYVFVYGTLRQGEGNHHLLLGADLIAEQSWTYGKMYDTGNGYPAIKQFNSQKVYGEIFAINENELRRLDELEGFDEGRRDNLYDRVIQKIYTDTGEIEAFVYVASHDRLLATSISSGDWKVYQLLKNETILYFAYGSCMDNERFIQHGVDHYFIQIKGCGVLGGYTLRFTKRSSDGGRADIVEEGGRVEGKVYELPIEAVTTYLYNREGVGYGTYRPTLVTINVNGETISNVLTFVVIKKEKEIAPPSHYEKEIIRGASGYLSNEYVNQLIIHMNKLKGIINNDK
jgi:gamma-glutamylcyclotransferase (GGCT)/AIG2-like uncharacterized protein YtfP/cation transport regulator ChaC